MSGCLPTSCAVGAVGWALPVTFTHLIAPSICRCCSQTETRRQGKHPCKDWQHNTWKIPVLQRSCLVTLSASLLLPSRFSYFFHSSNSNFDFSGSQICPSSFLCFFSLLPSLSICQTAPGWGVISPSSGWDDRKQLLQFYKQNFHFVNMLSPWSPTSKKLPSECHTLCLNQHPTSCCSFWPLFSCSLSHVPSGGHREKEEASQGVPA